MTQRLKRKDLLELRLLNGCAEWRKEIEKLLKNNLYTSDDNEIEIPDLLIQRLYKEGSINQIKLAEQYGIIGRTLLTGLVRN